MLITRSFSRELRAVSNGIFEYYKTLKQDGTNIAILRRNTHRLEKAMVMYPRRAIFGLDYIEETVDVYEGFLKHKTLASDKKQVKWSYDVLKEFFSVSDTTHPLIAEQALRFNKFPKPQFPGNIKQTFVPYTRSRVRAPVSYQNFLKLSLQRRSVRWFKNRKVPRLLLDKAIDTALLAPTSCNRQPFQFRIFDDRKLVHEIAQIPFGSAGYAHNIPVIIVLIGDMSNFFSTRDRHLIYIDASLSTMAFMYALETLGLSSTGINWPDFGPLEGKMARTLGLKPYERPVMLIAVGYPDENRMVAYSAKKRIEDIRTYNEVSRWRSR